MSEPDERSASGLSWTIDRQSGLTTFHLRGDLDLSSASALRADVEEALGSSPNTVLDLEEIEFMDSTGLRTFALLQESARTREVRFRLAKPSPAVLRVLDVSGLIEHFDYVEGAPRARACPVCEGWIVGSRTRCVHCGSSI